MSWKVAAVIVLLVPLAGCADTDRDGPAPDAPVPAFQQATQQAFFANATVPGAIDLERLSKPVFDILQPVEEFVTASDGIRISNTVFRPDTDEPVPIFINFSPYWGDTAATKGDAFGHYLVDNLVPRGYAVSLSAVRGTGHSEGCFEVASDREVLDLYEVIDHYSKVEWSNGAIAAGGKSYDSTSQNGLIANHPHPALKGIFHVSGITDMYSYTFRNGVLERVDGGVFTTTYSSGYGGDQTCPEYLKGIVFPASTTATGAKTPYWIERDWTRTIGASDWRGSIFFYHGFQDWNVQPSHILPWIDNLPDDITQKTKIWLHQDTEISGHLYPMRTDWNVTFLRWLDQELKGIDTGFWMEPRVEVTSTDGTWHVLDDWPAPLVSATTAVTAILAGPLPQPPRAVVDITGLGMSNATGHTHITGALTVHVNTVATNPDPVATAVIRLNGEWVGEAVLRLIYRDTLDMPSPVVPGLDMPVALTTYPLDIVVGPNDELTIDLGVSTSKTMVLPQQLQGVTYNGDITVDVPATLPTPRAVQPTPMECFAC